jgi:UTP--glucose-1-phosphate uridylyltransferase
MLPVGRKPVVQYVCEELTGAGLRRILFITGPGKTSLENHFDINEELVQLLRESGKEELLTSLEFERADVQYFYTRQRKALGLGHAVLAARAFVGHEPFVVALGDSIIGLNRQSDIVRRMRQVFDDKQAAAVIALEEVPREEVRHYGIAQPRQSVGGLIELADLVEKPSPADAPSTLAIAARYVLSPSIFEALDATPPGVGGEIQLTDAIRRLIRNGGRAYGIVLGPDERRFDIGNFDAYFRAFVEFALADPKHGPSLRAFVERLVR